MKTKTLFFIFASCLVSCLAQAQCLVAGEAVAVQEKYEGQEFIKIKICAYNSETNKIEPLLGLTRVQVNQFLDRSAKLANNSSLWGSLKTMGFQDRADMDKKLEAYFANDDVRMVTFSAALSNKDDVVINDATKKVRRNASEHVAELYNMMYSKDSQLLDLGGIPPGKENKSKNHR